jgi:hypothetical protein
VHWPPAPILYVLVAFTGLTFANLISQRLGKSGEKALTFIELLAPLFMQVAISIGLMAAGLYVILSGKFTTPDQHWAYGVIGTVTGFWLKGSMTGRKK